jgi:hypothetical protein
MEDEYEEAKYFIIFVLRHNFWLGHGCLPRASVLCLGMASVPRWYEPRCISLATSKTNVTSFGKHSFWARREGLLKQQTKSRLTVFQFHPIQYVIPAGTFSEGKTAGSRCWPLTFMGEVWNTWMFTSMSHTWGLMSLFLHPTQRQVNSILVLY